MKEVLKEVDYEKILSIAEAIDDHGEVTPTYEDLTRRFWNGNIKK